MPEEALSAIDGAHEVIRRLQALAWPDRHPLLGGRHAVVYKIRYAPVAPHTLPADAYLTVDRRLLPGDDPDAATAEIREAIGDLAPYRVAVMRGVTMLPALVDPAEPWVRAVQAANVAARGREAAAVYGRGTFDAGGLCARGIPAVVFGASGGVGLTGPDFVALADVEAEARVLAHLILDGLG